MKGLNTTLLLLLTGLLAGIVYASTFQPSLKSALVLLPVSLFIFGLLHVFHLHKQSTSVFTGAAAVLVFFSLGLLAQTLSNPLRLPNHYINQTDLNADSNFVIELEERLAPGNSQARFTAQVLQHNTAAATGKILVTIPKDSINRALDLDVDNLLYVDALLQTRFPVNAPYQFDYGAYLKSKGIFGQIRLTKDSFIKISSDANSSKFSAHRFRSYLKFKLNRYELSPDSKAITYALLLGERQDLSTQLRQSYVDAGVIHILAVSGLHVGILMLIVQFLLKPLGNQKKTRLLRMLIVLAVIWLFAILTGLSPSVLRAATMFSFLQIGLVYGQRRAGYNALIASALILLLINPNLLLDVGFQLSYTAVFFIMWLYPKLEMLWKPKNKILGYYWQLICVSLAAQVGVLPLSLYYFHQFPGLFLIANLVVLPVLGFILIYGILILILALPEWLPKLMVDAYDFILRLLNNSIGLISQADYFIFKSIYFPLALIPTTYLLVFGLGKLTEKFNFKNVSRFLIAGAIFPLVLLALKLKQQNEFHVLNSYRSTSLANVDEANNLSLYLNSKTIDTSRIIKGFKENLQIKKISIQPLKSIYNTPEGPLLIIDSLAIYQLKELQPKYILLTQSPKVNLDRLIAYFPKAILIADASNYRSYVKRWEATCEKRKIPFHSTYEKGFYSLD
ncbi:ComEC/Rec2 family competence protein [Leeuwenhoekiella parthenopeia]|uniref:ComEC family competence protein n=1 Tax=Leeuwenhoekiella parthenopeia TaxID=2890320 RepID=A0ABS8GV33_9FLAO|nr:ComEC family competence protein [Leeuwenhoekiella parthenopeia]